MKRDLSPADLLAYGAGVCERASQSMLAILVPLWALQLHAPAPVIGLDVAASALAPMVLSIPMGAAADRLGGRRLVLAGALLAAATTILSAAPNYWLLGLWQLVSGVGRAAAWIGAQTLVSEGSEGSDRTRRLGWLSLAAQIGNLSGPLAGGLLIAGAGATAAFGVAAGAMALLVVGGLFVRGGAPVHRHAGPEGGGLRDFARAIGLFGHPGIRLMAVGTGVRLATIALKGSFYVVLLHQTGFGPAAIGLIFTTSSAFAAMAAPVAGAIERRLSNLLTVLVHLGAMVVALAATPFVHGLVGQMGLMAVFGVGIGVTQPALISLLARSSAPGTRGLAIGLRTAINRAAQFVTPSIFGVLAAWLALPVLFPGFAGLMLCLLAFTGHRARAAAERPSAT